MLFLIIVHSLLKLKNATRSALAATQSFISHDHLAKAALEFVLSTRDESITTKIIKRRFFCQPISKKMKCLSPNYIKFINVEKKV